MTRGQVLVVDGNPAVASAIADLLAAYGFEPRQAVDVDDAVNALGTHAPSAAVIDVHDWHVDGRRLVRNIRTRFPEMPIVLTSPAWLDVESLLGLNRERTVLLVKPFEGDVLIDALKRLSRETS